MSERLSRKEMQEILLGLEANGQGLKENQRTHINHADCPAGTDTKQRLYILNTGSAHLFKCHHCGVEGYYRNEHKVRRADEVVSMYTVPEKPVESGINLEQLYTVSGHPIDADAPVDMRMWLYSYGFTDEMCAQYEIKWTLSGVLLPVREFSSTELSAIQLRVFNGSGQKYLTQKWNNIPFVSPDEVFIDEEPWYASLLTTIVLTEDILSAYKVSAAGGNAFPLLGTHVNTELLTMLSRHTGAPVVVWLDNDTAGKTATATIVKQLRGVGCDDVYVLTDKFVEQPKELSLEVIHKALHGVV